MEYTRPVRQQVLDAARRLAGRDGTFRLRDVVAALLHLNPGTVRTHVASRCCVNAPAHHQTRWPYFRALGRGTYRLERNAALTSATTRHRRQQRRRGWQDPILEGGDLGIDPTLIASNLKLTPTERLERMRAFLTFVETVRNANGPRLQGPVRSTR